MSIRLNNLTAKNIRIQTFNDTTPPTLTWNSSTVTGTSVGNYSDNITQLLAYGNSTFVSISMSGTTSPYSRIHTSTNGSTFTYITNPIQTTARYPYCISFGSGIFVIGMTDTTLLKSSNNGATWATQNSPLGPSNVNGIANDGNGNWVLVGAAQKIYKSSDNTTTYTQSTSPIATAVYKSVAYGNGMFVAGTTNGRMIVSSDNGTNWVQKNNTPNSGTIIHISYATKLKVWLIVSGANLYKTKDFVTYDFVRTSVNSVTEGNGVIFIRGNSSIVWSKNLVDFGSSPTTPVTGRSLAFGNNTIVTNIVGNTNTGFRYATVPA